MNASPVQPVDLMSADESPDRPLLEITAQMPGWLSAATDDVRNVYGELLTAYHASAARLEAHLDRVLVSFEDFTREQLTARIQADLGLRVEPDLVVLDLPNSVRRDYDIDPQFGRVKSYSAPWVASTAREALNLCELARVNFPAGDEQMAQRLMFAMAELDEPGYVAAGLTASYLHELIPQLDVAQGYRTLLDTVFRVPGHLSGALSEQAQRDADLLLEPYEYQALLEGLSARSRHRLSEAGYQLFKMAAQARSLAETNAAHLEMNWLLFKPGTAISGESDGHTLRGPCAIRDQLTDRTLIYLPEAPGDWTFIEAASPDLARSRLIQQLISHPGLIEYLAERTLDSGHQPRHVSYINQALARNFEGFITLAPALDLQISAQQVHIRAGLLYRMTQAQARSKADLARERSKAQNQTYLAYFRAMLGWLPGIGTLISVQDGWMEGHAAAQAFNDGRLDDGLLALGSTALSVVDIAMSIVPGVATVRMLSRVGARAVRLTSNVPTLSRYVVQPFEGYAVQTSLAGAVPQTGRDLGTLFKDGQLWIQREGQAYGVYRRGGENTLRLKKTAGHGYEPPVRLENGAWVYHSDVGLKGGVRSAIAEALIANANPDPAFKTPQARQLLDEFRFPPDRQRRLELDFATYYEKHRVAPDWAEAWRRPPPVALPAAHIGGGKRKDAPTADSQAKRAAVGEAALATGVSGPESWKGWGRPMDDAAGFDQLQIVPPTFRPAGQSGHDFIQLNGLRYEILPSGGQTHPSIVFLKNPVTVDDSFGGLNENIRRNRYEQPIMASFKDGQWAVHGPLFRLKIQHLVEQARPGWSAATNRILAEKIFEAADHADSGLTATRLINIKGTLNAWRNGGAAPLAGLNDPLLLLEGASMYRVGTRFPSLRVGSGPSLRTFNRADFAVHEPSLVEKLMAVVSQDAVGNVGKDTLRELMSALMTRAGYSLISPHDVRLHVRYAMLFRRPGLEQVYLLKLQRFNSARPTFGVPTPDSAIVMSNRWIDEWVASKPAEPVLQTVAQAREQGRLVKLIGGIKVTSMSDGGTQVFVQRLADDF